VWVVSRKGSGTWVVAGKRTDVGTSTTRSAGGSRGDGSDRQYPRVSENG
jgi:hypothetical protein